MTRPRYDDSMTTVAANPQDDDKSSKPPDKDGKFSEQKPADDEPVGAKSHHEEQNLDMLYRDVIFEHYRRPHNKRAIDGADIVTKGNNPVCGDRVTVYGKVGAHGKLEDIAFDGKGCAICIAS